MYPSRTAGELGWWGNLIFGCFGFIPAPSIPDIAINLTGKGVSSIPRISKLMLFTCLANKHNWNTNTLHIYSKWITVSFLDKKSNVMGRGGYFFNSEFFLITVPFSLYLLCVPAWVLPAMPLGLNQVQLTCIRCLTSLTVLLYNYYGCFKTEIHWTPWF